MDITTEVYRVVELFRLGGVFMYPLLLCLIVSLVIIIERTFILSKNIKQRSYNELMQILEKGGINPLKQCLVENNPMHRVILASLSYPKAPDASGTYQINIEVFGLERGVNLLKTIGLISLLLGFLGGVFNILLTLSAVSEEVYSLALAKSIYEALIPIAAGLIIAIFTLIFYNFFIKKIAKFRIAAQVIIQKMMSTLD